MNVIKSIDTDGSGTINYTGINLNLIIRILGSHYIEKYIYEIRKTVLSI